MIPGCFEHILSEYDVDMGVVVYRWEVAYVHRLVTLLQQYEHTLGGLRPSVGVSTSTLCYAYPPIFPRRKTFPYREDLVHRRDDVPTMNQIPGICLSVKRGLATEMGPTVLTQPYHPSIENGNERFAISSVGLSQPIVVRRCFSRSRKSRSGIVLFL